MRSRLAIIAMLVFGGLLSTSGGALAVSGFSSQQDNAAQGQYGGVQGEENKGGGNQGNGNQGNGNQGVLGEEESGAAPAETGTQPSRQVEAGAQGTGGGQLPFTGFAAIPILLGGVALLTTGLVLRKRTADDH